MQAPFFNSEHLNIANRYVAWLDVMGSRSMMTRSLRTVANFVFKLHVASLEAQPNNIVLYPMNDGVFAVGDDFRKIQGWLTDSFKRISLANQQAEGDQTKVFLARAAVAYGPVAEGRLITSDASSVLSKNQLHRDAILVGAPVVNAFLSERYVSPFGIFVHESARTFAPAGKQPWSFGTYMRYWAGEKPPWVQQITEVIRTYLDHCERHSNELDYPVERIEKHRTMAREFFDFPFGQNVENADSRQGVSTDAQEGTSAMLPGE